MKLSTSTSTHKNGRLLIMKARKEIRKGYTKERKNAFEDGGEKRKGEGNQRFNIKYQEEKQREDQTEIRRR